METETANSREKKTRYRKEEGDLEIRSNETNAKHTTYADRQTDRQTSRSGGTSRQESEQNLDVLATVHERNIATFSKRLRSVLLSPRHPPPPNFSVGV